MRILAVFKRVILEMLRDRRTLALMMFGPLLMLSLIWAMFQTNATQTTVLATQNVDASLVKAVDGTKHLKVVKIKKNKDQTGTAEPDANNQTAAGNAPNTACSITSDRQAAVSWQSVNGREKSCG